MSGRRFLFAAMLLAGDARADDAGVPLACTTETHGAVEAARFCAVAQEYEQPSDAGLAWTTIRAPGVHVLLHVEGTPVRGRVPDVNVRAMAWVDEGASSWVANGLRGSRKVVLTSVRRVKNGNELHGTIEATLVPNSHEAIGTVDLRVEF
jgi:hypothetical protein